MGTKLTRIYPETLKAVRKAKANHETSAQTLDRLVKIALRSIKEVSDI